MALVEVVNSLVGMLKVLPGTIWAVETVPFTVIVNFSTTSGLFSEVATTVHIPLSTPVTFPLSSTDAIVSSVLDHKIFVYVASNFLEV